jgi:hypothetical protein
LAAGVGAADFMEVAVGSAAARAVLAEEDITEVVAVALEVMAAAETAADLVAVDSVATVVAVPVVLAVAELAVMVLVEESLALVDWVLAVNLAAAI